MYDSVTFIHDPCSRDVAVFRDSTRSMRGIFA